MDKYMMDSSKLLWHMDRVHEHYRDGKRIPPIHMDMGVTSTCNSDCVYCYAKHQRHEGEILDKKVFLRFMEDAPKAGLKSLAIIGDGEPTMNPALYEAVEIGKKNGLDISVGTNGIILGARGIDALLRNCVWIRFNLSAASTDAYRFVHGRNNWGMVSHNIKLACDIKKECGYKCTIGLQMVLVPQCLGEVIPEAEFAIESGVDYLVIKQYSDPICSKMVKVDREWYSYPETVEILKKAESLSTEKTKIIVKWGLMGFHDNKPYKNCVDLPLLIESSGTGKIYPCGYHFRDERYCMGDLNKQSFSEIISSERYWGIIDSMRKDFVVGEGCHGACRHDRTNEFIWNYINKPEHINFI